MQESVTNGPVPDREETDGVHHPVADEGRGRKIILNVVALNAVVDVGYFDALSHDAFVCIVRGRETNESPK